MLHASCLVSALLQRVRNVSIVEIVKNYKVFVLLRTNNMPISNKYNLFVAFPRTFRGNKILSFTS